MGAGWVRGNFRGAGRGGPEGRPVEGGGSAGGFRGRGSGRAWVVVLATPREATQDAVREAGNPAGKIVFDCTDPLAPQFSGLAHGADTSGAELVVSAVAPPGLDASAPRAFTAPPPSTPSTPARVSRARPGLPWARRP
jgi:hypothetical protein